MRSRIRCVLSGEILSDHGRQITTGFCDIEREGAVELSFSSAARSRTRGKALIEASIEGRRVMYDTRDGKNLFLSDAFDAEYFDRELDSLTLYYKRSCHPPHYARLKNAHKIRPLGLNYKVSSKHNTIDRGTRPFNSRQLVRGAIERNRFAASILRLQGGRWVWVEQFEHPPDPDRDPTVLFMARLWDPDEVSDPEARQQRESLNQIRADCVRAGREAFGRRFFGGLAPDDYSRRVAPDCLLHSGRQTDKRDYLSRVKEASVCVATTGLHDSIGWKMAEYVAASRAIVSEPLRCALPGSFTTGVNYAEFASAEDLVREVERLLTDRHLRGAMMQANWDYYRSWVRPSALVWHTIQAVLG